MRAETGDLGPVAWEPAPGGPLRPHRHRWTLLGGGSVLAAAIGLAFGIPADAGQSEVGRSAVAVAVEGRTVPATSATTQPRAATSTDVRTAPAAPAPAPVSSGPPPQAATTAAPAPTSAPAPPEPTTTPAAIRKVTGLGDSIMTGAAESLRAAISDATGAAFESESRPGRPWQEGIRVLTATVAGGRLGDAAVVHLGTNGLIDEATARALLDQLAGLRRVVVVNVHAPTLGWQDGVNEVLAAVAPTYPNVRMVDWHAAAEEHPEWLQPDRIHLRTAGNAAYAALVTVALLAP